MYALGQKRTLQNVRPMSALPAKADITERRGHVRFVPKAGIHGLDMPCSFVTLIGQGKIAEVYWTIR